MANPNLVKGVVLNPHGRLKGTKNKFSKTVKEARLCCTDRLGAEVGLARPGGIGERALA